MRKNLFIVFILLLLIAAATFWTDYYARPSSAPADTPQSKTVASIAAPDFSFTDLNGRSHDLSSLKGKIVILHFWATWCPPCIHEFPKLVEVSKEMKDDVVLLAVSSDKSADDIARFTRDFELSQNIYVIQDKNRAITHDLYQTFAYPETILVDRNGQMVRKIAGDADWTSPEMRDLLRTIAAQ